ncbi:MAG: enoyl-CoA hydratase/isomerase family protein [Candidatus Eremiobacteraeota bacterium]|nr:enoyl-CoA hydratase/isomerase family protein [Candidatus Eremiobacteraeota bacterium]
MIESTSDTLAISQEGGVVRLALDRPAQGNALDVELARALMYAAIACDEDETVRCVVLTGTGKLFCAGGDIGTFAAAGEHEGALLKELTAYLHVAMAHLARMPKPFVTAINGPAAGAGLSLAALGDIVIAKRSAHFTLAYSAIGLSPDGGSTWLLPRLVGLRRAQELAIANRRFSADEAAAIGLITRAVDDEELEAETDRVSRSLASAATAALGRTRALLQASFSATFESQMETEARAIAEASRSTEHREGVRAFLDKRKPDFTTAARSAS